MARNPDIDKLLADGRVFITYVPLRTEVPFRDCLPIPDASVAYEIAPRASLDPSDEAAASFAAAAGRPAAILIPGRRFDASGTRHGQGGGWYDRYLSQAPKSWLRIGFCFERQFSLEPLPREAWDQIMDYLLVVDEKNGACRVIETHARERA
ncbi:hypothetical protein KGQ55_02860 [Patescibacteria group bacterium]|nr:hypothetical protein [Patescibacteria group bacterium]